MLSSKRYVVDPSLIGAALRLDVSAVMRDGNLLGRLLDTFAIAQLRAELPACASNPRLYHLRQEEGRHELDVLGELGGRSIIGVEIKAASAPDRDDAKHLAWVRDRIGDRFVAGVVLHTGPGVYALGDRIVAAPICTLWS